MKCKVCGKRFSPNKENRYEIMRFPRGVEVLYERAKILECFDCPKCGCQNIVNIRETDQEERK